MAKEIERKFLTTDTSYRIMAEKMVEIRQGYISGNPDATVRVRIMDETAFLTLKSRNRGMTRDEWEYHIPIAEAIEMLEKICDDNIIHKYRYKVPYGGYIWEIDEFISPHKGLTIAEIELNTEDSSFIPPPFIGKEVTGDPAYYNSSLARQKY